MSQHIIASLKIIVYSLFLPVLTHTLIIKIGWGRFEGKLNFVLHWCITRTLASVPASFLSAVIMAILYSTSSSVCFFLLLAVMEALEVRERAEWGRFCKTQKLKI